MQLGCKTLYGQYCSIKYITPINSDLSIEWQTKTVSVFGFSVSVRLWLNIVLILTQDIGATCKSIHDPVD